MTSRSGYLLGNQTLPRYHNPNYEADSRCTARNISYLGSQRTLFTSSFRRRRTNLTTQFLKWAATGASIALLTSYFAPHVHSRFSNKAKSTQKDGLGVENEPPKATETSDESPFSFPKNFKNLVFLDTLGKNSSQNAVSEKNSSHGSWRGLSFLKSSMDMDELISTLSSWSWPSGLANLQEKSSALLLELSRGPGSLYSQIVHDPPDAEVHPECAWDADVRLGDSLCISERAFLRERRRKMTKAFAHFMGINESEVDERDLPTIAIAGSGGGFRAMLNTSGSLIGAKKSGLLDCVTYISGISGSCWTLGTMYSGIAGSPQPDIVSRHIMDRIQTSYVDPSVLDMLINKPTNKYLLAGILRKAANPVGTASLVDLYGTLVSSRLFIPRDLDKIDPRSLSLYHFKRFIDDGSMPLPIFTAIFHEIPASLEKPLANTQKKQDDAVDEDRKRLLKHEEEEIQKLSSWLWFEFTPYEVGCDRLGAWIPSWSLGRRFEKGRSIDRAPEVSFTILTGIFASAFCASLQLYFNEVAPILRQLPSQLYNWLDDIITENKKEMSVKHAIEPNELPNFLKGMTGLLREESPEDITRRDTIGFMDAGAELNIPYYPLLRREVDCIIALDASADSQDLWFTRAEEYAARLGISTWPKGARWPALIQQGVSGKSQDLNKTELLSASEEANRAVAEAQEKEATQQVESVTRTSQIPQPGHGPSSESSRKDNDNRIAASSKGNDSDKRAPPAKPTPVDACTIWMGSSTGEQSSSRLEDLEAEDLSKRDGIAIVYNPLIPNDVVPGFDPMSVSTWSFSMPKEESEKLLKVSEANFLEGEEKIKKLLRAIWLRKKLRRESLERRNDTEAGHL